MRKRIADVGVDEQGLNAFLGLLADAVACREEIPLGAHKRVGAHVERFAQALRLDPEAQSVLERGAILRDIGKIAIPNEILLKKSVLDYDEWTMLQAHPRLGADLLTERGICADVAEVVRHHHECWDGDGYPDHLEKDAIPYLARILKIVDVYCAMPSPRLYREGQSSHEEAVAHFVSERGKHYDPMLIDVFIDAAVGQKD
jgi:response regulator RpfG family c-di-GMP phosphodiesterase